MTTPIQKLKDELLSQPENMIVLAGIGVSLATCPEAEVLTWRGLLKNGLERCCEIGVTESRIDIQKKILDNTASTPDDYVAVGTFITGELRNVREGEYGRWLADTFRSITPTDKRLIQALRSLGIKLSTTNYDHLIEYVGGGATITWREPGPCSEFFRRHSEDVLHFHGSWRQPESIVLGLKSYADVCNDPTIQSLLIALLTLKTIVFVGCGRGLDDPNFGTLLEWSRETLKHGRHDHFILVKSDDVQNWRERLQGLPIIPISFGQSYRELAPFIEELAREKDAARERENPSAKLLAAQISYDESHTMLSRTELAPSDYLRRERALASELRKSGGNRQAAVAFSNSVTSRAENITPRELFGFSLDAAEMLLAEDLASVAANHLQIADQVKTTEIEPVEISRLNMLQIRCYAELSAYRQLLDAISRELTYADANQREELEAQRDEVNWLQGEYVVGPNKRVEP